jgi:hypothetical protein
MRFWNKFKLFKKYIFFSFFKYLKPFNTFIVFITTHGIWPYEPCTIYVMCNCLIVIWRWGYSCLEFGGLKDMFGKSRLISLPPGQEVSWFFSVSHGVVKPYVPFSAHKSCTSAGVLASPTKPLRQQSMPIEKNKWTRSLPNVWKDYLFRP